LKKIKTILFNEFMIEISISSIHRTLGNFSYSLKKSTLVPAARNTAEAVEIRFLYAQRFLEIMGEVDDKKFFFMDEMGCSLLMRQRRGLSLIGVPATLTVSALR
jgi:hypothetical protein